MEFIFLLKGLIIGFAMAVPIGPIGVLCIRKTLAEGHARGLIVGFGAATADALYGGVAAFGLTLVTDAIVSYEFWLRLAGGTLLLFLGARTFVAKRKESVVPFDKGGLLGSYIASFILAMTNPVTIFAFIAVFAALGLGGEFGFLSACILVVGVFAGSCLWFLLLGYIATLFRTKLDSGGLRWVNRVSGALIIASGGVALASVL